MGKRLLFGILILMLVVAGCAQSPAETPAPELLKVIGQVGGPTRAVAVQENYAYVGVGLRLVALDVSTPTVLQEVGATQPFEGFVEDVAVSGNIAYVAAGGAGLYLVDISNPVQPTMVGVYDTAGYAEGVAVSGQYGYVADGPSGLCVVDISDPTCPTEVGTAYSLNYAFDVVVEGRYAYLAAAGAGLLVADVSDPTHPVEVGSLDTPGYAYGLTVSGSTAYIADGWGGLRLVDISAPTAPAEVGFYDTPGWAFDVGIADNTAYVADAVEGLRVVDVSDRTSPGELGSYEFHRNNDASLASDLAISGALVYVADLSQGLHVLDVSDPAQPTQVGVYSPMGYADDVAVVGDYTCVAAGPYGLRVIDISNPSHPREVGGYDTHDYALSIDAVGNYAYVGGNGLHIVDISNPSHPSLASFHTWEVGGHAMDVVVRGGIAYIADEYGIRLIDVSNPYSPVELGSLDFAHGDFAAATNATWGVDAFGDLAYVTHGTEGLKIVDVSNPCSPAVVGVYRPSTVGKLLGVEIAGNFAYVTDHPRLHVVDISDSKNPTEAGFYDMPTVAERVVFADSTLYAANGAAGLVALDVSRPHRPTLMGSRSLPGYALGLTVSGHYGYVADGEGGLFILERTPNSETAGKMSNIGHQLATAPKEAITVSLDQAVARTEATTFRLAHPAHNASVADNQLWSLAARLPQPPPDADDVDSLSTTIWTVTSAADSGPGTLRWCLENARSGDTIIFDPAVFPPESPVTISLTSGLPCLSQGNITIDASNAGVILDGSDTPPGTSGLDIKFSSHNVIQGLQILHFPGNGVLISGAYNTIGGGRTKGRGLLGEGNLISGNGSAGVDVGGASAVGNRVIGNFIGTDLTGRYALGNQATGVFISGAYNTIGGMTAAERNVISGNERAEVGLTGANGNRVIGNYIGTDASGSVNLGISWFAVGMELGTFNNVIQGNLISTNGSCGIMISDWGSWCNEVIGNFIGVDATGTVPLGGTASGVGVNASFNKIGGMTAKERNVISGNQGNGIKVGWLRTTDAIIIGNFIGTDVSGTRAIGNVEAGVVLSEGTRHSFIGGTTEGERNVISGNGRDAVRLDSIGVEYNFVAGNYIGTDVSGAMALPNQGTGIKLEDAEHNVIQGNLISGSEMEGISLGKGAGNNLVHHNNFIRNAQNSFDEVGTNLWDYSGEGNYWSDYKGKDGNWDGIGDTRYEIPGGAGAKDSYPLMEPFGR